MTGTTINFAIPVEKKVKPTPERQSDGVFYGNGRDRRRADQSPRADDRPRPSQTNEERRIGILDRSHRQEPHSRVARDREPAPNPSPGDGAIQVVPVSYEGKFSTLVEAPVPPLADDKACYWFRVKYVDGADRAFWTVAAGNLRPLLINRIESAMKFQPPTGPAAPMQLTNDSTFKVQFQGKNETHTMQVRVLMNPVILAPGADGDVHSKVKFSSVSIGMKTNGQPVNVKEKWNPIAQAFLKTSADFAFDEDGAIVLAQSNLGKPDAKMRAPMTAIGDHLLQSVEVLSVALPNRTIRPQDKIRTKRSLLIGLPEAFVPAEADVKYQYLGLRTASDDRQTAVFELTGNLRPRRGDDHKVQGKITGTVELLAATGEVFSGNSTIALDMEFAEAVPVRLQGSLVIDYRRVTPKPAGADSKPPAAKATPEDKTQPEKGESAGADPK